MSYHTNAVLNPLPRLGRRSVGLAGALGALGLGAINATLGANIVAVARKFPNGTAGEVIYLAVAGTPGLSPAEIQAVTPTILSEIIRLARKFPTMSAAEVVNQVINPRRPPVLKEASLATQVAGITRRAGPAAGALFKACMTDPIGARETNPCVVAAEKQVGTLSGDQLSFYNNCLTQKASDVPVLTQHSACYTEAKKLSAGAGPPPPSTPYTPPPDVVAPAPEAGGLISNKWVWIGGAVAAVGLAYVLLKKPAPAHA